jgi:hypothetical protein
MTFYVALDHYAVIATTAVVFIGILWKLYRSKP